MGLFVGDSEPSKIFVGDTPISKVFLGDTQVRPSGGGETVQTFDFQNDGALSWTAHYLYGTPSYVSGQGWTLGSAYSDSQSYITPPSSVYNGETLQKVKLWVYKGATTHGDNVRAYGVGAGVGKDGASGGFIWSMAGANINYDRINISGGFIQTVDITGEVLIEADYTGATAVVTINGNVYNTLEDSSLSKSDWSNSNFGLRLGNWRCANSNIYIRKVEITTA